MAVIDFSNAHIQPYSTNPITTTEAGLSGVKICNLGKTVITSSLTITKVVDQQKQIAYIFRGAISQYSTSDTEFYITNNSANTIYWRIYNISFNGGDSFEFKITANIV